MAEYLPIPLELLPRPRLIIWHGDPESDQDLDPLLVLRRTYSGLLEHGLGPGRSAGGNDWTGWHLPDREAVLGLGDVAAAIGRQWWKVLVDVDPN